MMKEFIIGLLILAIYCVDLGYIWQINDIHTYIEFPVFQKGVYEVDTDVLSRIMEFIRQEDEEVQSDAILFLGDMPTHDLLIDRNEVKNIVEEVYDTFLDFFEDKLVLSTAGNHDAFPRDLVDPDSSIHNVGRWIFDQFSAFQSHFITDEETMKSIREKSYYSYKLSDSLKIILIQSAWYNGLNLYRTRESLNEMFEWLDEEMNESNRNGEKVIIAGHIPIDPSPFVPPEYHAAYLNLLRKHQETIFFCTYGHLHHALFTLIHNNVEEEEEEKEPILSFVGPSIFGVNPRVSLYEYDKETLQLTDILIYTFYKDEINKDGDLQYFNEDNIKVTSYRDVYQIEESEEHLTPRVFEDVVERLMKQVKFKIAEQKYEQSLVHLRTPDTSPIGNEECMISNMMNFIEESGFSAQLPVECEVMRICHLKYAHVENILRCIDSFELFQEKDLETEDIEDWSSETCGDVLYEVEDCREIYGGYIEQLFINQEEEKLDEVYETQLMEGSYWRKKLEDGCTDRAWEMIRTGDERICNFCSYGLLREYVDDVTKNL